MLLRTKMISRSAAVMLSALLVAATPAGPASAQAPSYLTEVDDLPLAPGLVEDVRAGVVFDKPEGRIVQAVAAGRAKAAGVRAFYAETLPALGWQHDSAQSWSRGQETLKITVEPRDDGVVVRFAIAPNTP